MFGRRTKETEPTVLELDVVRETGKGRPTPSRKEAEATRKKRMTPPKNRKEANAHYRDKTRNERTKARQAMMNGEERYLPARDQGPVRRWCRDYVDSHRTVAEFLLPILFVILILSMLRNTTLQTIVVYVWFLLVVALIFDSLRVGRGVRKGLTEKFPNESHKGTMYYSLMRSWQFRRWRLPRPQIAAKK